MTGPGDDSSGYISAGAAPVAPAALTAPSPIRVDLGHHDRSRPGRPVIAILIFLLGGPVGALIATLLAAVVLPGDDLDLLLA